MRRTLPGALTAWLATGATAAVAAESPCPPSARLEGADALVAPIGRVLRARGVNATGAQPDSCRQVAVRVRPAGTGFHLVIQDAEGRTSRRQLPSAESAALVIESWSRGDLAAELPAPAAPVTGLPELDTTTPITAVISPAAPAVRESETTAASASPPAEPITPPAPTPAPAQLTARAAPAADWSRPAPPAFSLALAGESALARNRSSWWGASAAACLRTGPLCSGLIGRYGRALAAATTELDPALVHQEVELALGTRLALPLGPFRISPSLGLGMSRAFATLAGTPLSATASPAATGSARDGTRDGRGSDRRMPDPRGRGDGSSVEASRTVMTSYSAAPTSFREDRVLAEAGLGVALPITSFVAIELGASFGYAVARIGQPSAMPRERLRAGLGLRYGTP